MAAEAGHFTFADVVRAISDKMIARHPHVFGDEIPRQDGRRPDPRLGTHEGGRTKGGTDGRHAGRRGDGPAGADAGGQASEPRRAGGFDWPSTAQVIDKLIEESRELAEAQSLGPDAVFDEMGDLLFVVANLARHLKVDPEAALRAANAKFTRRFRFIEAALARQGKRPEDSDLAEMDAL